MKTYWGLKLELKRQSKKASREQYEMDALLSNALSTWGTYNSGGSYSSNNYVSQLWAALRAIGSRLQNRSSCFLG